VFLDPHATDFFRDWDQVANDTVAILRAEAGRDPYDRRLSDLIGELSTRSDEFRVRWAAHNVRIDTTGVKLLHHPVVGNLDLPFESFPLATDPSQSLLTYTAEPDSRSQEALNLLASWAATSDEAEQPARTADDSAR
jgi:MmyB-like transcription regulator ligand binding domain